jgi:hypothetical protein
MKCWWRTTCAFAMLSLVVVWDLIYRLTEVSLYVNTRQLSVINIEIIKLNPIIGDLSIPRILLRSISLFFACSHAERRLAQKIWKYLVDLVGLLKYTSASVTRKAKVLRWLTTVRWFQKWLLMSNWWKVISFLAYRVKIVLESLCSLWLRKRCYRPFLFKSWFSRQLNILFTFIFGARSVLLFQCFKLWLKTHLGSDLFFVTTVLVP